MLQGNTAPVTYGSAEKVLSAMASSDTKGQKLYAYVGAPAQLAPALRPLVGAAACPALKAAALGGRSATAEETRALGKPLAYGVYFMSQNGGQVTDEFGNQIMSANAQSVQACAKRCEAVRGCVAYSYDVNSGRCQRKPQAGRGPSCTLNLAAHCWHMARRCPGRSFSMKGYP
jgi:hypothetical protein